MSIFNVFNVHTEGNDVIVEAKGHELHLSKDDAFNLGIWLLVRTGFTYGEIATGLTSAARKDLRDKGCDI